MSVLARPAEAPDLKLVAPVSRSWVTGCSSQATLPVRRRLDRYVIVNRKRYGPHTLVRPRSTFETIAAHYFVAAATRMTRRPTMLKSTVISGLRRLKKQNGANATTGTARVAAM